MQMAQGPRIRLTVRRRREGHQSIFVMMLFIVVLPPLYYAAVGLWRKNTPLTVIGFVFLAVHFSHVFVNLTGF